MLFIVSIVVPLAFLIGMELMEQVADYATLDQRLIKVGWDLCVLAMGVAGAVCLAPEVVKTYGQPLSTVIGMLSIAFSFVAAGGIALIRRQQPQRPWVRRLRPLVALALGGAAIAVPSVLTLWKST